MPRPLDRRGFFRYGISFVAMGSENLHEPADALKPQTIELHRAIVSLMEELEAIDWYGQRADACGEPELREVLLHNRREEIEHAMMTLEWIRRRHSDFEEQMRTYLFSEGSLVGREEEETGGEGSPGASATGSSSSPATPSAAGSLSIGSLRPPPRTNGASGSKAKERM